MAQHDETFLHRWFEEVWNKGRSEAIDEMFAADGAAYGLGDDPNGCLRGPAAFKPLFEALRSALPDVKVTVEDTVVQGDKIAARCRVEATHTGPGLGVAPTGRRVAFTGMTIVRVKDGQIVEAWNNFDFAAMMQQIHVA